MTSTIFGYTVRLTDALLSDQVKLQNGTLFVGGEAYCLLAKEARARHSVKFEEYLKAIYLSERKPQRISA